MWIKASKLNYTENKEYILQTDTKDTHSKLIHIHHFQFTNRFQSLPIPITNCLSPPYLYIYHILNPFHCPDLWKQKGIFWVPSFKFLKKLSVLFLKFYYTHLFLTCKSLNISSMIFDHMLYFFLLVVFS